MEKLMKTAEYLKVLLPAKDFVVCGSTAASLLGIKCNCKDLDVVLITPAESTIQVLKDLQEKFPVKNKLKYPNNNLYRFTHGGIEADVFISQTPIESQIMYKGNIKIATLNYVVSEKLKLNRPKDYIQLKNWADQIMSAEKLKTLFTLF